MMHSRSRLLLMALLLVAGTVAMAWDASAQEPVTSRFKLAIGGYIKAETIYHTTDTPRGLGATSNQNITQFGFAGTAAQANTFGHDNGHFIMAANESRLGFTLTAPNWRGLRSLAYLETDFQGDIYSNVARVADGNAAPTVNNGAFRIRHAYIQLSGEGLGGSWNVLFGQTWNVYGLVPFYGGSTVSFGGATIYGGRGNQLRLQHQLRLFRDFTWENTVAVSQGTIHENEAPMGEAYTRLIYSGWQGWQGGVRRPLNAGFSAGVTRTKADLHSPAAGSAVLGTASTGTRSLSAVPWGITGGLFLPILPGRSATDRTWALSAMASGGYTEGLNVQVPAANPFGALGALAAANPTGITTAFGGSNGGAFFHPGKCSHWAGTQNATNAALYALTAPAAAACGANFQPTELSLVKESHIDWDAQFYLPWGFWLAGGQKYMWFSNSDNAVAQTCINGFSGAAACAANATGLITPVLQGRANPVSGAPLSNNGSNLYASRDAVVKRFHYSRVALFHDMTPNIRLGFEWGLLGVNRKDSAQDAADHRWHFAAYYFF